MNNDLINKKINYNEELKNLLDSNKLITTRIGNTESSFLLKYKFNYSEYDDNLKCDDKNVDLYMKKYCGLYYKSYDIKEKVLNWWCENTFEIMRESILTSCFLFLTNDLPLWAYLDLKNKNFYNWGLIHKFLLQNIGDKKLLYIGSAVDSIKRAYNSDIQNMWKFKIEDFTMSYVKTPQTTLSMPYPHISIIETTNIIVNEIINNHSDFDVAILGCGSYGPPIMNLLKKKLGDKNMLYLGSSCYTMFGLYSHGIPIPNDDDVIKENWIEVLEKCDPNCLDIDQGKYWKKK